MTILAVFRSRAQSLDFISLLKSAGVPVQTVATPSDAGVGCGISAKFDERFLPRAKAVLARKSYASFAGLMRKNGEKYYYF